MDKQHLLCSESDLKFSKNFGNRRKCEISRQRIAICWLLILLFIFSSFAFTGLVHFLYRPNNTTTKVNQVHLSSRQRPLPNCLIIGARKCGTRALIDFMDIHPHVRIAPEEVHYFDDDVNYDKGLNWYRTQMPSSVPVSNKADDFQIVAEKSPSYFIDSEVPHRVKMLNSSMRLLLILRNPVTRVISDYAQMVENRRLRGRPFKTLENAILHHKTGVVNPQSRIIQVSLYPQHLSNWFHHFKLSQFHIVDGDKLIVNPLHEIRKVERFLDLPTMVKPSDIVYNTTKGFYCIRNSTSASHHCLGKRKGRKHPDVHPVTLQKLNHFFRPHNQKLFSMTGRKFDW